MEDIKSPSSVTIEEYSRIVKEFEEKIQNGTEDPDRFLTIYEIEELWSRLIGETNVLYSDMLQTIIRNIDEKELIRRNKGVPSQRNKIAHSQARRPAHLYDSWPSSL